MTHQAILIINSKGAMLMFMDDILNFEGSPRIRKMPSNIIGWLLSDDLAIFIEPSLISKWDFDLRAEGLYSGFEVIQDRTLLDSFDDWLNNAENASDLNARISRIRDFASALLEVVGELENKQCTESMECAAETAMNEETIEAMKAAET